MKEKLKTRGSQDHVNRLFETRSHTWEEAGLARQLSAGAVRRARVGVLLYVSLIAGVLVLYSLRQELFGVDLPVRIATVFALVALGWQFARDLGRAFGPTLFRRLEPGTAGTVGFLVRLATIVLAVLVALRIAGLRPETLAVGGAFTAVILGLAAQQTFGNLFAGLVLLSARPFRVGDRVRLQGGGVAGQMEGIVSSLGLLYTTFASGEDQIMVPNAVVLAVAVTPLHEPEGIDIRARLRAGDTPLAVQRRLDEALEVELRDRPKIILEEVDDEKVIVRIQATPQLRSDGPRLASEVLHVVQGQGDAGPAGSGTDDDRSPVGA